MRLWGHEGTRIRAEAHNLTFRASLIWWLLKFQFLLNFSTMQTSIDHQTHLYNTFSNHFYYFLQIQHPHLWKIIFKAVEHVVFLLRSHSRTEMCKKRTRGRGRHSVFFLLKSNPLKNRSITNSYIYSHCFFLKNSFFFFRLLQNFQKSP